MYTKKIHRYIIRGFFECTLTESPDDPWCIPSEDEYDHGNKKENGMEPGSIERVLVPGDFIFAFVPYGTKLFLPKTIFLVHSLTKMNISMLLLR